MAQPELPAENERDAMIRRVADRLTVVCGFGELLRDGAYGSLTPEQQRILATLVAAARDSGALFHEMLQGKGQKPGTKGDSEIKG